MFTAPGRRNRSAAGLGLIRCGICAANNFAFFKINWRFKDWPVKDKRSEILHSRRMDQHLTVNRLQISYQ